jgi:hypothetical protein
MRLARLVALACATSALAACGGGGGGSSSGDNTLQVSVTFPRQTLSLFQPAQVQPSLSGFEGYTPACTLLSGQIPPGMQLNGNCTIAGVPTVQGTYGFTLRVSAAGVSNSLEFNGGIGVQGPGIQYPQPPSVVGAVVSSVPTLSWWPAPVQGATWNYAVKSGTLAPGLTLNPATGAVSGTLSTQGSFTAQIGATLTTPLGVYEVASTPYGVIADMPRFSYQDPLVTRTLYLGANTAFQPRAELSDSLSDFVLVSGALPPGLALDPATGIISGVPGAAIASANFEVEATVTRAGVGNRVRAGGTYEIRTSGHVLYPNGNSVRVDATFNTISPVWETDSVYAPSLGLSPTFAPKPGSCTLPAGVTSLPDGRIDGHPTQLGAFQCTFSVTYAVNGAQWSGEAILNLEVVP